MTHPQNKRHAKSIFSVKGFQGRVVVAVAVAGLSCVGVNAYLCYAYVVSSYDFIFQHSTLPPEAIDGRYAELLEVWAVLSAINVSIVLVVALWAMYVTHRAAGPIYHLRKTIEKVRAGKLDERLHLRHKDDFQELARDFNELLDELQQKRATDPNRSETPSRT
jgi:methyl-accepting chemotaxis protein